MKKNSSEAAFERKQFLLDFINPEAANEAVEKLPETNEEFLRELREYDEGIADCHDMFLYFKDINDEEEMAFWRRMEQEAKTAKRLMMKKYNSKEEAAA